MDDLVPGEPRRGFWSGAAGVNEQAQQQPRVILLAAGAADVNADLMQGQLIHDRDDEVDEVAGGHPVAQVGREQQRGVAVNGDEPRGHAGQEAPAAPMVARRLEKIAPFSKSDMLPG